MFIYFLYMFRATMCPSSGETTAFMEHLVLAILKLSTCFRTPNIKCRVNTVVSPNDGHVVARNMQRKNK